MPFQHSENKQTQQQNVEIFRTLVEIDPAFEAQLDFAVRHKAIIDQFGRFPHRNKILSRQSTTEEIEFLQQPNSGF